MLQEIRERAQGWIAWFIVILISVPFALWGISSYLDGGSTLVVASVNGQEISEREFENGYRQFRQRVRDQLGSNYRPELMDDARMREEFLQSMIRERVVLHASSEMGFSTGDTLVRAYINSIPAFSVGGTFNKEAYERVLRNQGLSPVGFEAQVRQSLMTEQLSRSVSNTEFATNAELQDMVRLRMQRRGLDYMVIPAAEFKDSVAVTESEVQSYYDSNQQLYMAPERVKLEYIELDVGNLSATLKADEASLLGYYEQHKREYVIAERRRASHILFTLGEGAAAEADALKQATAALERISKGEEFTDVAKELSQDPGSAEAGGDLGFFEKGIMDKSFEDVAFALSVGEVSKPVKSSFGYHIIKLTAVEQESGKRYEEVKDQIKAAYLKSEAEKLFYEYAERLSDLAYEDPDSLQPAAAALGIETKRSEWVERSGGSGPFASPKVVGAAFSDDVLLERHNSEAIEIGAEHIIVLRVVEHEESSLRPLDKVKDEIVSHLKSKGAAELARQRGQEILASLAGGASLESLATDSGLKIINVDSVDRDNRDIPAAVATSLFRLPKPAESASSFGEAVLENGDFAVLALNHVADGSDKDAEDIGGAIELKSALERSRGQAYYQHLIKNLQESANIVINKRDG
ncbi:MAG: SurA N-terminal domain-containing protein [Gammaproteobacteria bacterium]|nr:SurA N-terminal domain-containing protein [Gammaproteobacteria bacterium]